jgi:hypothetical protein
MLPVLKAPERCLSGAVGDSCSHTWRQNWLFLPQTLAGEVAVSLPMPVTETWVLRTASADLQQEARPRAQAVGALSVKPSGRMGTSSVVVVANESLSP